MQRNRQRKRNRNASDIEVDRELEAQPEPSQAQKNKKASGEARRDRHDKNTWHAKKAKRHTVMRGVCAAGLEAGAVVASEVVEARLVTQSEALVEACSMRALLGSLLLGLAVRGWFTRVRVLPDGQEVFEEIPAEVAVIPNVADRNMYLQLVRGRPPPGRRSSRPSEAVEDVLAFYPGHPRHWPRNSLFGTVFDPLHVILPPLGSTSHNGVASRLGPLLSIVLHCLDDFISFAMSFSICLYACRNRRDELVAGAFPCRAAFAAVGPIKSPGSPHAPLPPCHVLQPDKQPAMLDTQMVQLPPIVQQLAVGDFCGCLSSWSWLTPHHGLELLLYDADSCCILTTP
ncbi:hypothetical protein QJQ45_026486 [Haematococcus lacustris]|nr:hypothetical protein QJQ45_026486 [Haematococcus lacustris]